MPYPGGKGQAGVYQQIICQLPPHTTYIEPFLGGGAIMRYKRPARRTIGVDLDPGAIAAFADDAGVTARSGDTAAELVCGDALDFLRAYDWQGGELVYLDPPYLLDVRSSTRPIYTCEFATVEQHTVLLELASTLPAMVAISGYWSSLYATRLENWRAIHFSAVKRSGERAEEWLWMNYPEPQELHDYRFLGNGFRERERIQRRIRRWEQRLSGMPRLERLAMMAALAQGAPDRQIER